MEIGLVLVVIVVVVRIGCIDQLSRDEVTSLTYISTLWVNVSFGKLFHGVAILLRRKHVLGSFPLVRARESSKGFLRSVIFWSLYLVFVTPIYFLKIVDNLVNLVKIVSLSSFFQVSQLKTELVFRACSLRKRGINCNYGIERIFEPS